MFSQPTSRGIKFRVFATYLFLILTSVFTYSYVVKYIDIELKKYYLEFDNQKDQFKDIEIQFPDWNHVNCSFDVHFDESPEVVSTLRQKVNDILEIYEYNNKGARKIQIEDPYFFQDEIGSFSVENCLDEDKYIVIKVINTQALKSFNFKDKIYIMNYIGHGEVMIGIFLKIFCTLIFGTLVLLIAIFYRRYLSKKMPKNRIENKIFWTLVCFISLVYAAFWLRILIAIFS